MAAPSDDGGMMDAECMYDACMSETIQVRNVPKKVHAELVRRAKAAGLSLNTYLLGEFERMARISRNEQLLRELHARPDAPKDPSKIDVVKAIREGREEQDRKWDRLLGR
jgi:hypothetical protein